MTHLPISPILNAADLMTYLDLHRTPSFSLRQKGVNTNSIRSLYSGIQGIFHSFEKATLGEK